MPYLARYLSLSYLIYCTSTVSCVKPVQVRVHDAAMYNTKQLLYRTFRKMYVYLCHPEAAYLRWIMSTLWYQNVLPYLSRIFPPNHLVGIRHVS